MTVLSMHSNTCMCPPADKLLFEADRILFSCGYFCGGFSSPPSDQSYPLRSVVSSFLEEFDYFSADVPACAIQVNGALRQYSKGYRSKGWRVFCEPHCPASCQKRFQISIWEFLTNLFILELTAFGSDKRQNATFVRSFD